MPPKRTKKVTPRGRKLAHSHLQSVRLASFQDWPFTEPSPEVLALDGFYATATLKEPHRTTCFSCGQSYSEWKEGDNVYDIHSEISHAELCGWNFLRTNSWEEDGLVGVLSSELNPAAYEKESFQSQMLSGKKTAWPKYFGSEGQFHPRSEFMAQARKATFDHGWPYTEAASKKEGLPTADEISAAGWYFRPTDGEDGKDRCLCIYCGRAVEGWEAGDDPLALHRRKLGVKCPFFTAKDFTQAGASSTKGSVASASSATSETEATDVPTSSTDASKAKKTRKAATAKVQVSKKRKIDTEDKAAATSARELTPVESVPAISVASPPIVSPRSQSARNVSRHLTAPGTQSDIAKRTPSPLKPLAFGPSTPLGLHRTMGDGWKAHAGSENRRPQSLLKQPQRIHAESSFTIEPPYTRPSNPFDRVFDLPSEEERALTVEEFVSATRDEIRSQLETGFKRQRDEFEERINNTREKLRKMYHEALQEEGLPIPENGLVPLEP